MGAALKIVSHSAPQYEFRAGQNGALTTYSVWELPSTASPHLGGPTCVASLHGWALEMVEARVLRRLKAVNVRLGVPRSGEQRSWALEEEAALHLALLFRISAPMRSVERVRQVVDGLDRMSRDEAAYWLGMAVHRKNPRRVLAALRMLLTAA